MPEYPAPGVYIEEAPSGSRPIEGVSTSTAAFVGPAFRGPLNEPVLISSYGDYLALFTAPEEFPLAWDARDEMTLAIRAFYQNGGSKAYVCRLGGGPDSAASTDDYERFFTDILSDVSDVSIILLPGKVWSENNSSGGNGFISKAVSHCESCKNRMVIIDPENLEFKDADDVTRMGLPVSSYSVLYYPWLIVDNPLYDPESNPGADRNISIAPSATAAGMWARTEVNRGVWKAAAGNEATIHVAGLAHELGDLEQDFLNPLGVNCIRNFVGIGAVIWGSRTLATRTEPQWRYVSVRRTAIFVEQSIYIGTQWAVFEPNTAALWSQLRNQVGSFLNGIFRDGGLQGARPDHAYYVRCGLGHTMTQWDIDHGQVVIDVGLALIKPAEFVVISLQQQTALP